jgi:hypothetical protein
VCTFHLAGAVENWSSSCHFEKQNHVESILRKISRALLFNKQVTASIPSANDWIHCGECITCAWPRLSHSGVENAAVQPSPIRLVLAIHTCTLMISGAWPRSYVKCLLLAIRARRLRLPTQNETVAINCNWPFSLPQQLENKLSCCGPDSLTHRGARCVGVVGDWSDWRMRKKNLFFLGFSFATSCWKRRAAN